MNLSFYEAIDRIPLGVAVTVEFVGPLGVALAGSRSRSDVAWSVLAAGGVALLTTGGGTVSVPGIVLALVAGGFWAAYILLSQQVGSRLPGMSGLAAALLVATVVLLPSGVAQGGAALGRPAVLGTGFGVAMLSSAVPYSLELAALRRLPASLFGVLMSLEPATAALSGLLLLGQRLAWREWLGIVAVSAASAGAARRGGAPAPPDAG
jgi:inner membrane transporter RhtA